MQKLSNFILAQVARTWLNKYGRSLLRANHFVGHITTKHWLEHSGITPTIWQYISYKMAIILTILLAIMVSIQWSLADENCPEKKCAQISLNNDKVSVRFNIAMPTFYVCIYVVGRFQNQEFYKMSRYFIYGGYNVRRV